MAEVCTDTSAQVLECGSGLTTIIAGLYAPGRVMALEHDANYMELVDAALKRNKVEADVLLSPIVSYGDYDWYDDSFGSDDRISLIVCDGPPGATPGGRYGVVPATYPYATEDFLLLLDDANRSGEIEVLARWKREFNLTHNPPRVDGRAFVEVSHPA